MAQNNPLIKNIMYYLQRHLFGVDTDNGNDLLGNRAFGVFMSPGQFMNPSWKENSTQDMYFQSELLDEILSAAFIYTPQVGSISGQYQNITSGAALPKSTLSTGDIQKIEALEATVAKHIKNYEIHQGLYFDAFEAYENEQAKQTPNQATLQRLLAKKNTAFNNWGTFGKKDTVEQAYADMAALQRGNPSRMWLELETRLRNSKKIWDGQEYYRTELSPSVASWNSPSASWAQFEKTISETETHSYSKTTTWSGSLGVRWGLFNNVSIGANGSKTVTHNTSDVTVINVSFEYSRVRIIRKWLDQNIFNYPFWTWKKNVATSLLSNGGDLLTTPPTAPVGLFPFLPTSLLVVKNVVIQADFSSSDVQTMNSLISGSVSAGFGPFSVRGSYSENVSQVDIKADFDGTTLKIPNPQIIGFMGVLLPKTPNPNKKLPFDLNEAWFPEEDQKFLDDQALEGQKNEEISAVLREYASIKQEVKKEGDIELAKRFDHLLKSKGL
jgi:hypothetical protein